MLNIDLRVEKQQHHLMGVYYSGDITGNCTLFIEKKNFFYIQKI